MEVTQLGGVMSCQVLWELCLCGGAAAQDSLELVPQGWGLEVSCDSVLSIGLTLNRTGKRTNP